MTVRPSVLGLFLVSCLSAATFLACGDEENTTPDPDGTTDASMPRPDGSSSRDGAFGDSSSNVDGASDAAAVVRSAVLPFSGKPNGLFWDNGAKAALYVADEQNDSIVKWTDEGGFTTVAKMPGTDDAGGLGQLVRLLDGTLVVTRFGFGREGTVYYVATDGGVATASALAKNRRRIGLAPALDNGTVRDALIVTYFTSGDAGRVGTVATLRLFAGDGGTATESTLIDGLKKPVGVLGTLAGDGGYLVTDQDWGVLLRAPRTGGQLRIGDGGGGGGGGGSGGGEAGAGDGGDEGGTDGAAPTDAGSDAASRPALKDVVPVEGADLLCAGPDGATFVTTVSGKVLRIAREGTATTFREGFKSVHGCAYDGVHRRLFVGEVDPAGSAHAIHVVPVD